MSKTKKTTAPATAAKSAAVATSNGAQGAVERLQAAVTERLHQLTGGGELMVPAGYSVNNAVAAWWLKLQIPLEFGQQKGKKPIELATKESVVTATLDMVVMGLDPNRSQCYPIVYGNRLICQPGYFGRLAMFSYVYPDAPLPRAQVVYEQDTFELEYKDGELVINKHVPGEHHHEDGHEVGAYCVVDYGDGRKDVTYMPMAQIVKAWKQGKGYGQDGTPAHKNFPGEMAKKTVINRALKLAINASGHAHLVSASQHQEYLTAEAVAELEAGEHANKEVIDVGDVDTSTGEVIETEAEDVQEPAAEEAASEPDVFDAPQVPDAEELPPADQFAAMCEMHELDPSKARKVLADTYSLPDARRITNDMYQHAVEEHDKFANAYYKRHGKPVSKSEPEPEQPAQAEEPNRPDW